MAAKYKLKLRLGLVISDVDAARVRERERTTGQQIMQNFHIDINYSGCKLSPFNYRSSKFLKAFAPRAEIHAAWDLLHVFNLKLKVRVY